MYLDCDTRPPIAGCYTQNMIVYHAHLKAAALLEQHNAEGQIGLYENSQGGNFYGYVIRENGLTRFEPA